MFIIDKIKKHKERQAVMHSFIETIKVCVHFAKKRKTCSPLYDNKPRPPRFDRSTIPVISPPNQTKIALKCRETKIHVNVLL